MKKFVFDRKIYGMSRIKEIDDVPVVRITNVCSHKCIFCSAPETPVYPPDVAKAIIDKYRDTISIEGGEPTLSKDLVYWIKYAKEKGCRDIIICTNAMRFNESNYVRELLDAGATMFNVNFPAHNEQLFDFFTGTKGFFYDRVNAMRNLLRIAGRNRVRITLVVHSEIMKHLPAYAAFVVKEFPKLFYLELNMAKILGYVIDKNELVPRLKPLEPYLNSALKILTAGRMRFITDGFPLCYLKGFEYSSIDVYKKIKGIQEFMTEKKHSPKCRKCSLNKMCAGPRADYLKLYGDSEIVPSKIKPDAIIKAGRESGFLHV